MPPKQQPSKKNEQKRKEKVIEDKTFGMKNKKGHQNQKYVAQVENQIRNNNQKVEVGKKKKEVDELLDLNKLLRPVEQKVSKEVDPKSVVCLFFKQGMCTKGNKCKFSHDMDVEKKTEKRNLYVDNRDIKGENDKNETNENWDENKLKEVVEKKHGKGPAQQTTIVCKYFLQAVEDSKYGWFWECPNGSTCMYRHCLPEGYVLKKDRKKMEEMKEDEISLEELIEKERAQLSTKQQTKITLQSFVAWKKKKLREKKEKEEAELKAKKDKIKQGKALGMSGRDLFTYTADTLADDDDADDVEYEKEQNDEDPDEKIFEINADFFKFEGMDDDLDGLDGGSADQVTEAAGKMAINEDLFDVDDVDDLDSEDEKS